MIESEDPAKTAQPFSCRRLGIIMQPEPDNPFEVGGVLNPAGARDRAGNLHLFPRLVGPNNYSRIGDAVVDFNAGGDPHSVTRRGVLLEPARNYERNTHNGGGVEDPRITYISELHRYVMTYVAFSQRGPRTAIAVSSDLKHWQRLGIVRFHLDRGEVANFNECDNKDAMFFPEPVRDPNGRLALALLHRPNYFTPEQPPGIWISYIPLARLRLLGLRTLTHVAQHQHIMAPEQPWELEKVGMGTPPVLTPYGWLALYHGIQDAPIQVEGYDGMQRTYRAGIVIFDRENPRQIVYRTAEPVLSPDTEEEEHGKVDGVVFPTAIDVRQDRRYDFYYGMADTRVGAATFQLPTQLTTKRGLVTLSQ